VRVLSISVRGLEMPVDECTLWPVVRAVCAALCFLFTAHLHMYNRSVLQYCK